MKQSVTIYGKDKCPFTRAAVDALKQRGDEVVYIDVLKSQELMDEMLSHSGGGRLIPVIVTNGEVSVGWQGKT